MEYGGQPQYGYVGHVASDSGDSHITHSYTDFHAALKNLMEYRNNEKIQKAINEIFKELVALC
jgi:hypothetical protein